MIGLGEPRVVRAGVVGGLVLRGHGTAAGARPPARAVRRRAEGGRGGGADVSLLERDAAERPVGHRQDGQAGRPHGHDRRRARAVGAVSVGDRDHRQRRHEPAPSVGDDAGWARASDDGALRAAGAGRRARGGARRAARGPRRDRQGASRGLPGLGRLPHRRRRPARSDRVAGEDRPARAARRVGPGLRHRVLERREPDSRALGAARRRAGDPRRARREHRRAAAHAPRREPAALRCGCDPRRRHRAADGGHPGALCVALFGAGARLDRRREPAVGRRGPGARGGGRPGLRAAAAVGRGLERLRPLDRERADYVGHESPAASVRRDADRRVVRAPRRRRDAADRARGAADGADRLQDAQRARVERAAHLLHAPAGTDRRLLQGGAAAHLGTAGCRARRRRHDRAVARRRHVRPGLPVLGGGLREGERRGGSARAVPHRLAGILCRARRADHRRPRLHRGRPPRRRAGRHREPEPGAADVPDQRRAEPPPAVDRSGHEVHRRRAPRRAGSSASPPTWTTRTSCRGRR